MKSYYWRPAQWCVRLLVKKNPLISKNRRIKNQMTTGMKMWIWRKVIFHRRTNSLRKKPPQCISINFITLYILINRTLFSMKCVLMNLTIPIGFFFINQFNVNIIYLLKYGARIGQGDIKPRIKIITVTLIKRRYTGIWIYLTRK